MSYACLATVKWSREPANAASAALDGESNPHIVLVKNVLALSYFVKVCQNFFAEHGCIGLDFSVIAALKSLKTVAEISWIVDIVRFFWTLLGAKELMLCCRVVFVLFFVHLCYCY